MRVGELVHLPRPHAEEHVFAVDTAAGLPFVAARPGSLPRRATLLQTTTIALQAVHDASLKLGDRVAIFGLGAFGLLTVQLARLQGAGWIAASDPIADRRAFAERLGAELVLDPTATDVGLELRRLDGVGVDVAIEFSGSYAALQQAMRSVRVGGTVVAAGFYGGGELALGEEFHHNRLTLVASMGGWSSPPREPRWPRSRARALAAELLAAGRLEVARPDHPPLPVRRSGRCLRAHRPQPRRGATGDHRILLSRHAARRGERARHLASIRHVSRGVGTRKRPPVQG